MEVGYNRLGNVEHRWGTLGVEFCHTDLSADVVGVNNYRRLTDQNVWPETETESDLGSNPWSDNKEEQSYEVAQFKDIDYEEIDLSFKSDDSPSA